MVADKHLHRGERNPASTELVLQTSLLGYLQERQAVEEAGEGKQGSVWGPSQGNNLCGCLGEATEGLGGCGDGLPELRQVPVLGVLGDASHGLTQYLRKRGYRESPSLS